MELVSEVVAAVEKFSDNFLFLDVSCVGTHFLKRSGMKNTHNGVAYILDDRYSLHF